MPADQNLLLPLVVAGAALAGLGLVRVARAGLRRMPLIVAVGAILAGTAAASTGLWLRTTEAPFETTTSPAASAQASPVPSAGPQTMDVVGHVREASGAPAAGAPVVLHRYEG